MSGSAGGGESRVEVARLRTANTRLRQVVQAKDTEIEALTGALSVLEGRVAGQVAVLEQQLLVGEHRTRAPRYTTKIQPSAADMLAKLRRVLIATRYRLPHPDQPTPAEIHTLRLAWETLTA